MVGPFSNAATEIWLTNSCFETAENQTVLLHVLAHAIGLKHQHRRSDRLEQLILNEYAFDPIFKPFFDTDKTIDIEKSVYDIASVTQVSPMFLDQTGGRSPYGTLSSIEGFAFGVAMFFSHWDMTEIA